MTPSRHRCDSGWTAGRHLECPGPARLEVGVRPTTLIDATAEALKPGGGASPYERPF